jgi:hypothetical protein
MSDALREFFCYICFEEHVTLRSPEVRQVGGHSPRCGPVGLKDISHPGISVLQISLREETGTDDKLVRRSRPEKLR